ncbi:hypothetical protein SAMN02910451_01452 [Butyrivibrio hungatei]|uniref:AAA domain-containing protein n=1 Tax=Butyrivibrio hungatei TaxID=185008 RepID=A0A1G5DC90_9FIRM|nr:hypothetical protein [Butyrivibrio hungatei]SCY12383.1 hypothetical protein SAMN02910451_01452 [Butyrivibrio hungatei]
MKVYLINGPMGVGKTVTGKCIAEKSPGMVTYQNQISFKMSLFKKRIGALSK